MKLGSLFAGIGGFDLAAESLGWSTAWVSEIDPAASFWLSQHFPDAPNLGDVTQVDWATVEPIDILCGGFPCQPHSVAGKREASDDSRDLWSECVRAVGVLRPRYAVFENVPGLLTSESGRFFNRVISDLAALGYVGRYDVLSAAECGAPHRRERVWIVAYPDESGRSRSPAAHEGRRQPSEQLAPVGHFASGGRGAGQGEPVRRAVGGNTGLGNADITPSDAYGAASGSRGAASERRDSVGNATDERCEGLGSSGEQELRSYAGQGLSVRRGSQLRNAWADAIPYRGADGTVRLIPRGAVADASNGGERERLRVEEAPRAWCEPRSERCEQTLGHTERAERRPPSSGGDERDGHDAGRREAASGVGERNQNIRGEETESGSEPALRALADGIPDILARHAAAEETQNWETPTVEDAGRLGTAEDYRKYVEDGQTSGARLRASVQSFCAAEEVEAWPTPTAKSEAQTAADPTPGQTGGTTLKGAVLATAGTGTSLWPVTDSEPGRVARLKAVGNAVSPAWVLAGPFRFIQELEAALEVES